MPPIPHKICTMFLLTADFSAGTLSPGSFLQTRIRRATLEADVSG